MGFKERLRYLRESCVLTQEDLANKLSLTKSNISKYENGSLEPNLHTLLMLADLFGVTTDFLLGRTERDCIIMKNEIISAPNDNNRLGIEIEAETRANPSEITDEMVKSILESLKQQGYEIRPNKE